jgi:hypothetical protein
MSAPTTRLTSSAFEVRVARIGDSQPAPVFDLVAQPNDWQKNLKKPTSTSEIGQLRHDFFELVFDGIAASKAAFRRPKARYDNWMQFSSGPFGYYLMSFDSQQQLRTEIYLDLEEKGEWGATTELFDSLYAEKDRIESIVGLDLSWERLDKNRASRIAVRLDQPVNLSDEKQRADAASWASHNFLNLMKLDDLLRKRGVEFKTKNRRQIPYVGGKAN